MPKMMISQTAEYALRAVVWLAGHPDADLSTPNIARVTQAPPGYLSKVLQALSRAGLVESRPGRKGGFRLLRPPTELSVLDVVNAVDPVLRIRHCPLNLESHAAGLCPLHRRLDAALGQVEEAFAKTTIGELLADSADAPPLCDTHSDEN
jgi:Rrf2 family transcriptional regulator, nitric oxide-sensitive transcriptional repressor